MTKKIGDLKEQVKNALTKCTEIKREALTAAIAELPEAQQHAVLACFDCAKRKGPKGRRYTMEWMYECLLMKIKNRKLYKHIKERNILPLPSFTTLNKYIQAMGCAFGFQESLFETLKAKVADLPDEERRGILQLDEMKLTPNVAFDKDKLEVQGLVTLETEGDDKDMFGDHALVIHFQPFRGAWVQAVACFLTKSNANSDTLTKLTLEAILKLEDAGLRVDAVCTDGARWNRQMWEKVGATPEKPWCRHPSETQDDDDDENCRKLWYLSDFPHLLKCMRNCLVSKGKIKTSNGTIDIKYWETLLAEEEKQPGLRCCPKLTKSVVKPKPFEKMNVGKAFRFFGGTTAAGMKVYQKRGVKDLQGCDESVDFIRKTNKMADIMNSSTPFMALKPGSQEWEVLENYLTYFKELKQEALKVAQEAEVKRHEEHLKQQASTSKGKKKRFRSKKIERAEVFSYSTDDGLVATITATMQITEMLVSERGWKFLMTSRLNQDSLERFFGLIRQSSSDSHPTPQKFVQVYRLLATYSLVKPQKGSNITGGEVLSTLFDLKDLQQQPKQERKREFIRQLDDFVELGENLEALCDISEDHTYIDTPIDEFALTYVAGYVARKSEKFSKDCDECSSQLVKPPSEADESDLLITEKTYGWLKYPSEQLMEVIHPVEKAIMDVYTKEKQQVNIIFKVTEYLQKSYAGIVGCPNHCKTLTRDIVKFYITMRMHFLCNKWNETHQKIREKQRLFRKQAHET